MITINNPFGLGNVLKNIVSALKLADKIQDSVQLIQPHEHLFSIENNFPPKEEITKYGTWQLATHVPEAKFDMLKTYREFLNGEDGEFWYLHHSLDFQFDNIKDEVIEEYKKYFNKIKFTPEIKLAVKKFTAQNPSFIGVQIRTWKDSSWRNSYLHNLDAFKKIMDCFPNEIFYVSSDTSDIIDKLKKDYPNRIISAPKSTEPHHRLIEQNTQAAVEAAIDMLILSKSKEIIGTYESTFTEVAWWLADKSPPIHIPVPQAIINNADPRPPIKNDTKQIPIESGSLNVRHIAKLINKKNPVIIEIGANSGGVTSQLLKLMPDAQIFCFEADPRAAKKFKEKMAHYSNVSLIETAVGSANGFTKFYQSSGEGNHLEWDQSGSIKKPKKHLQVYPWVKFAKEIDVQITSLDHWVLKENFDKIDLIWVSAQGAEYDVIQGASKILQKTRFFFTSYSDNELYEGQPSLKEIDRLLPEFFTSRVFKNDVLFAKIPPKQIQLTLKELAISSKLSDHTFQEKFSEEFFFHTEKSLNPFALFDLGESFFLVDIGIKNRQGNNSTFLERAENLRLKVSEDCLHWTEIDIHFSPDLRFASCEALTNARFLYFYIEGLGIIHLKEITINFENRRINSDQFIDTYGFTKDKVYYPTHEAGFFSICSTILYNLARTHPRVNSVNGRYSFANFKDDQGYDPWLDFFLAPQNTNEQISLPWLSNGLHHHKRYSSINFTETQFLLKKYFSPSQKVVEKIQFLQKKYSIDFAKTIAVNYRGTDKHTEVAPQPFETYGVTAQKLLNENPGFKILIQSDQKQFRDYLQSLLGDKSFYIEEMPVTEGEVVIHKIVKANKLDFTLNLLATVQIMSKCEYLVTHTGNVAYWTVLLRGNFENVTQL